MSVEDVSEWRKIIADLEARIRKLEAALEGKGDMPPKRVSLKEFVISKGPGNDVQRVLTIGYYLEKYDGLDSFNVEDLRKGFRAAAEAVPGNLSEAIRKNVAKGHLMPAGQQKAGSRALILTNTGEKLVDEGFARK